MSRNNSGSSFLAALSGSLDGPMDVLPNGPRSHFSARHHDLYVCFENTKQADIGRGSRILQRRTVEEPENVRGNHNEHSYDW